MESQSDIEAFSTFGEDDISRVLKETPVEKIEFRAELPSTNDLALELADTDGIPLPTLVLTNSQTKGRGRQTNLWWSDSGSLTFSLVVQTHQANLTSDLWPQASLTAGLAVCEALESFLPDARISIKWPNDIFIGSQKVSGILVETPRLHQDALVIGIGINVNNSLKDGPDDISGTATSVIDLVQKPTPLPEVLIKTLNLLVERLSWVGSRDQELRESWRKRCLLTGRKVRVEAVTKSVEGDCQGIDDEGALLLQSDSGVERVLAGTVTILD